MEEFGLLHLYYGDGKGKSTAAAGLALRALGAGASVILIRFLKSDYYKSGEIGSLITEGAMVINGKDDDYKLVGEMNEKEREWLKAYQDKILRYMQDDDELINQMDEEEKSKLKESQDEYLKFVSDSLSLGTGGNTMLILDEALNALNYGLVDEELLKRLVLRRPKGREVVLTGRGPKQWMLDAADYITEFKCVKHPFENGIKARKGIEY